MKRMTMAAGLAAAVLVFGMATANAQQDEVAPRGRRGMAKLELTAEQRSEMRSLRSKQMKTLAPLRADVTVARVDLQELMRQKAPDAKALKKAVDRLAEAQAKMLKARVDHRIAMKQILTDEQIRKLEEMGPRRRMRGRHPGHFQGRRDRGFRGRPGAGIDVPGEAGPDLRS